MRLTVLKDHYLHNESSVTSDQMTQMNKLITMIRFIKESWFAFLIIIKAFSEKFLRKTKIKITVVIIIIL